MNEDGGDRVIEWSDEGEIPEDVLKMLKEAGVDLKILSGPGEEHEIEIQMEGDNEDGNFMFITSGDEEVIEMDGEKKIIIMKRGDDTNGMHPRKHKMRIHKEMKDKMWNDEEGNVFIMKGDGKHKGMKIHGNGGNVMVFGDGHSPSKMTDAYMGAHIGSADAGVEILELIKDGPADKAGLQVGDVIQEINGANTDSVDDLMTLLGFFDPGDKIEIDIQRAGKDRSVSLELAKRPDHQK
jgi:hypothetical protein